MITKALADIDVRDFLLRSEDYIKAANIDYLLETKATNVDSKSKVITLNNGQKIVSDIVSSFCFIEL